MPKVFTGKVMIPGDKIDEYLKFMEEAEKAREPFNKMCKEALDEFCVYLEEKKGLSPRTVSRHGFVISVFTEFLAKYTDVENLSQVTKGIANTHFKKWYRRKVLGGPPVEQLPVSIKKFFQFLSDKKGIHNKQVLGK